MQMFDGLTLARVVKFNPLDGSLDCQLLVDGLRLTGVPVMGSMLSTSSGCVDMHEPEGIAWDQPSPKTRDVLAVLGTISGQPVVLGFLHHPVSQMLFNRRNFKVDRHASDVYHTINDTGDIEIAHPSGTFIKIGENYDHEDLSGQDWDALWAITRNVGTSPGLRVQIANASGVMATLTIQPDGTVELTHKENLTINTKKTVTVNAEHIALKSSTLTHNGVNIGADHTHGGVLPGPLRTLGPG